MESTTAVTADPTYYCHTRPEMLPFVPATAQSVLEIGCAQGAFGAAVKRRTGAEVWGIEFNPDAAKRASTVLDLVLVGDADAQIAQLPDGYFEVVICNDVLEHLVDPVYTLKQLRRKMKPHGVVVASIPNIRFLPALSAIVVHKDFPREDFGIFDRTHLRFFTRKSMVRLFEEAGFSMRRIKGINAYRSRLAILLTVLTFGYFADSFYLQYACVASPAGARS
ncbi:class I SAM-dependent methyltransferase [Mycobacterium palustre]|uniref:SAM-dependent methyltransferase n=1 Tax=Mycobacterium palustre TaxID=153971 RepID=A0A1X1Z4W3_9MYCO|nr:class I SAM-dependent methyltransferase [Mycobacterium palustre]MCV7098955.1 class I SAM-dependent methyltransferase [Mycobacterium palustre]ORW18366.1 SAM-dependent methyltransferase [Mycobacterium palustre]